MARNNCGFFDSDRPTDCGKIWPQSAVRLHGAFDYQD